MKEWLSCEIGHKYEKTVALYKNGSDDKPLFSTTVSGDYRIPFRRLLIGAAIAVGVALIAVVSAELDAGKNGKRKKPNA